MLLVVVSVLCVVCVWGIEVCVVLVCLLCVGKYSGVGYFKFVGIDVVIDLWYGGFVLCFLIVDDSVVLMMLFDGVVV